MPRTRSAEPFTNASGLPRSNQYPSSTTPCSRAPSDSSRGKISRSTETGRPVGMSSMTERRNT